MPNFYVTFPYKNKELRDKFTLVNAPDIDTARLLTIEHYGRNWAFVYPETAFAGQREQFNLTQHEEIIFSYEPPLEKICDSCGNKYIGHYCARCSKIG